MQRLEAGDLKARVADGLICLLANYDAESAFSTFTALRCCAGAIAEQSRLCGKIISCLGAAPAT